jgi:hypothetical protein
VAGKGYSKKGGLPAPGRRTISISFFEPIIGKKHVVKQPAIIQAATGLGDLLPSSQLLLVDDGTCYGSTKEWTNHYQNV